MREYSQLARRYLASPKSTTARFDASAVPRFGGALTVRGGGDIEDRGPSRQLGRCCVEGRKAWRMLQSKAGVENREYKAQRAILGELDGGKMTKDDLFANAETMMKARLGKPGGHAGPAAAPAAKPSATGVTAAG